VPPTTPHADVHDHHHGKVRGADRNPRSPQFEGRFGRMFRTLPPAEFSPNDLHALAEAMAAGLDVTSADEADDEENSGISAGFTYLGQFIDHDLTFDPASSLQQQNDPDALVDFRTPRFDLDCVYGRGPDDQPYLYRADGVHMLPGDALTGAANDPHARGVPRNVPAPTEPARALIGDKRNDENVIVSQLHAIFLRFHNKVVDVLTHGATLPDFAEAQRLVRWHYQWVVLNDFLPTIIRQHVLAEVAPHIHKKANILQDPPDVRFYHPRNNAFIPVEFSVAAYRFGHSMVRPVYRLNSTTGELPIFSTTGPSLVGFEPFPTNLAVDWGKFFHMDTRPPTGPTRLLPAYKIDTSLVNPLKTLPASVAGDPPPSLAERNLLRGLRMGLPSGQAVASAMGVPPIPDAKLKVGKATEEDTPTNRRLTDISAAFTHSAPLWYYILAEAQQEFAHNSTPIRLGRVGGRIVAEVFLGLMLEDRHSFLRQNPLWEPFQQFRKADGTFGMAELIRAAQA
jgi:heme peroxidase